MRISDHEALEHPGSRSRPRWTSTAATRRATNPITATVSRWVVPPPTPAVGTQLGSDGHWRWRQRFSTAIGAIFDGDRCGIYGPGIVEGFRRTLPVPSKQRFGDFDFIEHLRHATSSDETANESGKWQIYTKFVSTRLHRENLLRVLGYQSTR